MASEEERERRREWSAHRKAMQRQARASFQPLPPIIYEGNEPVTFTADEYRAFLAQFNAIIECFNVIGPKLVESQLVVT